MNDKHTPLVNRELSWLSFNERVLQEASDPAVPLLERLRFLGIYSNNRDEFFRVRVATVRRLTRFNKKLAILQWEEPTELLEKIQNEIKRQQDKFEKIYAGLVSKMAANNIFMLNEQQLSPLQGKAVKTYFKEEVQRFLFPIIIDNTPDFPYLRDTSIYLVIKLQKNGKEKKTRHALVEIPIRFVPRFYQLPSAKHKKNIILLEDVIRYNLDEIFSIFDYDHIESYVIKITRDAELDIDNDLSKSFIEKISKSLKNRKRGYPVRLAYDGKISKDLLDMLVTRIKFRKLDNIFPGGRIHNFRDFIKFPETGNPALRYRKLKPLQHHILRNHNSLFPLIHEQDVLLFFPYHSYDYILNFLREASIDPKVESIKITLYRLATNSLMVNALINALKNGKAVTVVVELQARFDEEANIFWASQLQDEGAVIIYGVHGLKVHSKLFLISRKEGGEIRRYAHVGTGNFNEETSSLYSDISLLTADERITEEVEKLFTFYSNNYKIGQYKNMLVAPWDMRKRYNQYINREISNAKEGKEAFIWLKLNSLVDEDLISKLYQASEAGVKIKLIIRGICSLVPGVKGLSDNIDVISIVDKFLEHSRVLVFCNDGEEKYYIASADLMSRNLDHRSEVAVPIYNPSLQKEIRDFLTIQFRDNCKARVIGKLQDNKYRKSTSLIKHRSQEEFYRFLRKKL